MRVPLDLEQSTWSSFLMRCHEENVLPSDVVNAWLRRAIRQDKTIQPVSETPRSKVVEMKR